MSEVLVVTDPVRGLIAEVHALDESNHVVCRGCSPNVYSDFQTIDVDGLTKTMRERLCRDPACCRIFSTLGGDTLNPGY